MLLWWKEFHPKPETVPELRVLYVGHFWKTRNAAVWDSTLKRSIICSWLQESKVCSCRWLFFCCRAALMPLLDPDFTSQALQAALKSSGGICLMGLSLPSYSHFHISQSPVEFWCSWKNFWGLPRRNGLERISLPANCDTATSRRAPRAREESGKEDDGRVFVPLPLCLQKQITLGETHEVNFGPPVVLFPALFLLLSPSLLPVWDLPSV